MSTRVCSFRSVATFTFASIACFAPRVAVANNGCPSGSTDCYTIGDTAIGVDHSPGYGSSYSGFFRTDAADYSLLTDGSHTFVNAPNTAGSILFRGANGGGITDPTGSTSRMYLDSQGNLGVAGTVKTGTTLVGGTGNTFAIVSDGTNTYINAPSTGGNIYFCAGNGSAGTSGGCANGGPGAGSNYEMLMTPDGLLSVEGSVIAFGYDTTNPHGAALAGEAGTGVYGYGGSGNGVVAEAGTGNNAAIVALTPSNASTNLAFYGYGALTITGQGYKPGGGSWASTSDVRVKKDVSDFRQGLSELERIRPVNFKYNGLGDTEDSGKEYVGVIAQELEKVLPSMVTSKKAKLRKDDGVETDIKTVDPSEFTYLLINAVKEQENIIQKQEARIARLARDRRPLAASWISTGTSTGIGGITLGLVPFALVVARRRRKHLAD
jgi:hypothetical protein